MSNYTTAEKVGVMAKNIEISNGRAATLTTDQAGTFMDWADSVIDSHLNSMYYTPLRQIIRNGVTKYPVPIELISTKLASGMMVESVYSRIEPQVSDAGKIHKDMALAELDDLVNGILVGSRILEGQTRKSRNPFVNPNAAPLEPPKGRTGM